MEALAGLSEYRLLDRLIRGRIWIGLVAFALIGIVTLQLGLLKLNGDIGRALEREALVQRENAVLSIENSELTASDGVESRAARLGMEFVPQGALRFLTAGPGVDAAGLTAALSAQARSSAASGQAGSSSPAAAGSAESRSSAETPSSTESSAGSESSATSSGTPASAGGESPGTASTAPNSAAGESGPASATESARAAPSAPSSSSGAGGAGTAVAAGGGTQASAAGE